MPKIILIRGVPGSGKSTKAKELHDSGEVFIHLETDNYWIRPDGTYDWNGSLTKEAHQWNFEQAVWWLNRDKDIAIANTFTRIWEMQKYLDLAEEEGYTLEVIRCVAQYGNVHSVPAKTIQKMTDRFEDYEGEVIIGAPEVNDSDPLS